MRKSIGIVICLLFLLLFRPSSPLPAQCNGDPALCARRFDEVCYATTHNAFNYNGAFLFPNQSFDITRQMNDGVRGLMLDVYWYNNEPTCYHSSNFLGNQPLSLLLGKIKTFLDSNATEVVSIIFECYITAAQMNDVFTQAGLLPYLHAQPQGTAWPTLADMLAANHRLVVFTDVNDGQAYPWYHYVWDYAVETDYTAHSRTDFSCAYNRGDSTKSLFILNHMITQATLGYGLIDSAAAVNANPYLTSRAMGCWAATGKMPNFLTVDFYEQGDVMAARDNLNAGLVASPRATEVVGVSGVIWPNPAKDEISIEWKGESGGACLFSVFDLQGKTMWTTSVLPDHETQRVRLPENLTNGTYAYRLDSKAGGAQGKLVVLGR